MTEQQRSGFRRRALLGWYQALHANLTRKVMMAARRDGLNRAPREGTPGFIRLAVAEAPGLYEEIVRIRERM